RLVVQDAGAHVGELAELTVGDDVDRPGVVYDPGVGHEQAGDVRPVLVGRCADAAGDDGARDVAAAAGKGLHLAVGPGAVEPGDDGVGQRPHPLRQGGVGPL